MPKRDLVKRTNQLPPGLIVGGGATILLGAAGSAADTVDGFHASATPTPEMLLPLDSSGEFPASVLDLSSVVPITRQVIAGAGLIGGGDLSADCTLAVGAGTGISVSEDAVSLNLAADLVWTGDQTYQGLLTTRDIVPELPDTYDLGSIARMWRKAWISELDAVVFAEHAAALVGGWLIVPHDQGALAADVTTEDSTIDFGKAMTPGDIVCLRSSAPAVEYMQVGSLVSGTRYNVTRDLDGSGANAWPAGTVYLVLGQSGDGRIELNAQDTPRIQVLTQGATYNAQSEVVRIGSLNGAFGISDERCGFAVGDYAGGNYLLYSPLDGLQFRAGSGEVTIDETGILITYDALAGLRFEGAASGTYSRIYDSSDVSGSGGLGLFSSTEFWGIVASTGAKLAMDASQDGFLKAQCVPDGTGFGIGLGDESNNWVLLTATDEPALSLGIGTGATPTDWAKFVPHSVGTMAHVPPMVAHLSLDVTAEQTVTVKTDVRYAFATLGVWNLATQAARGWIVGTLARPGSNYAALHCTNDVNYVSSSTGGVPRLELTSTGDLRLTNTDSVTMRFTGLVFYFS